jgi:chromosome segregation ATPase
MDSQSPPEFGTLANHASANGHALDPSAEENTAIDSAGSEIKQIASAIQELQGRLERANNQLGQVAAVQTTEIEIGRLFVEAQRYSETAMSKLEIQVQEILVEAEAKANEIIREATEEAEEIRRRAQQASAIPGRTADELKSVIAGFANANAELTKELNALNALLTPLANQRSTSLDQTANAAGSN